MNPGGSRVWVQVPGTSVWVAAADEIPLRPRGLTTPQDLHTVLYVSVARQDEGAKKREKKWK